MENKGNSIITNVIWKFAERILAQVVSLIVSIVLARILLPEDYGAIAMVTVFITIANVFVTEGIPNSLIQKKNTDDLDYSSVFVFNLCLSIFLYFVIYISAPLISSFYNMDILTPVIRVMGLKIIVASFNSVQHAYVSKNMMFKKYFWSTLFGTLISGVIGIVMAYKGFGIWALVAQYMVNSTVDTIVLFFTVDWRPKLKCNLNRLSYLIKFGWKMLFEGVTNTIVQQLQNLIIGKIYTSADLAYYTKGQQFPSLVVTNISSAIASVLFPAIANEQDNENKVLSILRKSSRLSYYVVFPMLTGLAMVAKPFISIVLTEKWIDAVPFLQAYCIIYATYVWLIPRHQALNGKGRSDVYLLEHLLYRVILIGVLLLTFRISIATMVLGQVICSLVLCGIVCYTSYKYNGYCVLDQLSDALPSLIGCAVMTIPTYMIGLLNVNLYLKLLCQCSAGIVVYVSYSIIFKVEEYTLCRKYLEVLISKFKRR